MTPWLLAAFVIAVSAWHWGHGPTLGADDHGQYLLHARALLQGRSYVDIGFIHSPYTTLIAPVAEPPGLPVVVAGVFTLVGESLAAVRVILIASLICCVLAVWAYWRRLEGNATATVVSVWTVVALARLHVVDTVLADLPFIAAMWLVFVIADSKSVKLGRRHFVGLAAAGVLAFSFRMAALPLLPAMAFFVLLRPKAERLGLVLVGAIWTLTAALVLFFLPGADALGSEVPRTLAVIVRDVKLNLGAIFGGARHWIPLALPWRTANIVLHGVMLSVAAWGSLLALREGPRRFAYLAAAWYLVMLIVLPVAATRYMWPLFPFITFGFIRGVRSLVPETAFGVRRRSVAVAAATAFLMAAMLQDLSAPSPRSFATHADAREVVEALKREARERPIRAAFFSPRMLTWETGITTTAFGSAPTDALYNEVRRGGLTHVVVGDAGTYSRGLDSTEAMVTRHQAAFVPVLTNKSFVLYEFRGAPDSAR